MRGELGAFLPRRGRLYVRRNMERNRRALTMIWVLLFGIFAGSVATYLVMRSDRPSAEAGHQVRFNQNPTYDESPEQLLYPEGTTLEMLYPDEGFFAAIHSPDAISIHPADPTKADGSIEVDGYSFSANVATPDTAKRLVSTLCSISSYEPPGKLCIF